MKPLENNNAIDYPDILAGLCWKLFVLNTFIFILITLFLCKQQVSKISYTNKFAHDAYVVLACEIYCAIVLSVPVFAVCFASYLWQK